MRTADALTKGGPLFSATGIEWRYPLVSNDSRLNARGPLPSYPGGLQVAGVTKRFGDFGILNILNLFLYWSRIIRTLNESV